MSAVPTSFNSPCANPCVRGIALQSPYASTHPPRRKLLLLAGGCALTAVLPGRHLAAQTQSAESLPTALDTEMPGLRQLGTARLRFFGLDIYEARLWISSGFKPEAYAASPFALELNYLRSLSGKAIAERSLKEMQRQGRIVAEQEKTWLAAMERVFPDVKNGDRIVGAHVPGTGARFWFNGQPLPAIPDAEFSRYFFGIWLADATSEPKLRNNLLGRNPS